MAYLVALLAACTRGGLPAGDPGTPDIVLVSVDTLRADHLSAYGHDRPTSPFLDALAAGGTRFAHARSPSPWTLPAHSTLLSGQLTVTHQVVEDELKLDPSTPVLPELLSARGYATAGFVSTMYVSRLFGFERGFDHFEDFGIHTEKQNLRGETVARDVVDEALDWWADRPPGEPVFLFLHFYDVHYSYDPPEPYASMFDRPPAPGDRKYKNYFFFKDHPLGREELDHELAQYDEAIRYVDDQLARVGGAARAAGRQVRWVVTSDHGEEFGERGSWGHAHTLYAEQLDVPLVLAGPGVPAGQVVEGVVGLQDVAPTVAAWAGAQGLRADGIDLSPAAAGQPLPARPFVADTSRFKSNRVGLYEDGLRLEWDLRSGAYELFLPAADPAESADVATRRPDDVARLLARVESLLGPGWEARVAGRVETEGVILQNGRHRSLQVEPGARFTVVPADAEVRLRVGDTVLGPWTMRGGAAPGPTDPLVRLGQGGASQVSLDADTRAALEALGYMQSE